MLDIKLIRQSKDQIEKKLKTKDPSVNLSSIFSLDESLRSVISELETLQAEKNSLSKEIGQKKAKKEPTEELFSRSNTITARIESLEKERKALGEQLEHQMLFLPNIPFDEVKVAPDPKDNVCIFSYKEKPVPQFPLKNHVELNESLDLFDFKRGAKISGSGWPVYKKWGARLEWALIQYMMSVHIKNGFEQWIVPLLVKPYVMQGSAQLPKFKGQFFELSDADHELNLIPTSEVALNGLHIDEIFSAEELPKKYVSYTPCFRREAGAAGSQERGLIRVHQFNKVEMFAFTTPDQSAQVFDEFMASAQEILQGLDLHYRNMLLCTGDMSFAAAKTVDIEVWLPGQNRYYEVSSVSHCTDFQARRSQIRFRRDSTAKPELVHTLNGSGLATSRLMVAILENNQDQDGNVLIPKVLRPYLDGKTHLTKE